MPISPGQRGRKKLPPTSGNSPIPVSGMAKDVVSSATRWLPWTETPTPPPITMPEISATYGLGKRLIAASRRYSSR